MKQTVRIRVSENNYPKLYDFAERNSILAKNLYNAALFRIRQTFTGWDKTKRSANEEGVFSEIETAREVYPKVKISRVLTYKALDNIMRANNNPDFFAGLPMQTAQDVIKSARTVFKAWLAALKDYKRNPDKYLGKPRMPKYLKNTRHTFSVTNQDAVLYSAPHKDGSMLKLPGLKDCRTYLACISSDVNLRQVTFQPYYDGYIMSLVIENGASFFWPEMPNLAGIDLGTDNLAAISCTDGTAVVYKGGVVLSQNRLFAMEKAKATGIITKGHEKQHADSAHLQFISRKHAFFISDQLHKITTDIIRLCVEHRCGTVVIGCNRLWKQKTNIGKRNNQNFAAIPHDRFRFMLEYKALYAGICVIEQEESYTSKADITANDFMPVYGVNDKDAKFSGTRVKRGLYKASNGLYLNADCNGAANILRKAIPDAWAGRTDFGFLCNPVSVGFKRLNLRY